jgi:hypothetical protein
MLADGSALNFGHVKDCANGTYACTFVPLVGGRSVIKVRSRALKDRPDHARLLRGTAGRPHRRGTRCLCCFVFTGHSGRSADQGLPVCDGR